MMWVNDTLPPRARARWLLMTVRLSHNSLTGTDRTEVAVGTVSDASMFCTVRAGAPRRIVYVGSSLASACSVGGCSLGTGWLVPLAGSAGLAPRPRLGHGGGGRRRVDVRFRRAPHLALGPLLGLLLGLGLALRLGGGGATGAVCAGGARGAGRAVRHGVVGAGAARGAVAVRLEVVNPGLVDTRRIRPEPGVHLFDEPLVRTELLRHGGRRGRRGG